MPVFGEALLVSCGFLLCQGIVSPMDLVSVHLSSGEKLMAAPGTVPDEGVIHLYYVRAGISRMALLRLLLAMEKGAHLTNKHVTYVRVLRLDPHTAKGVIVVDGEVVE